MMTSTEPQVSSPTGGATPEEQHAQERSPYRHDAQGEHLGGPLQWFDSLSSPAATVVILGMILTLLSTAGILLATSASMGASRAVAVASHQNALEGSRDAADEAAQAGSIGASPNAQTSSPGPATPPGDRIIKSAITRPPSWRLRERPSTSARTIDVLQASTPVQVLEGAAAADGFEWLRVRTPSGRMGWVVSMAIE